MINTVDVVVVGGDDAAVAATIDKAGRGMRVMVVLRSRRADTARRIRNAIRAGLEERRRVVVLTGAEVACVDGVNAVEAVVIRDLRTGRLTGVNASEVLCFEGR